MNEQLVRSRLPGLPFNRNYLSWRALKACLLAKVVTLRIFGDEHAHQTYLFFAAPHPQFPLIPRKSLGAALIRLAGSYSEHYRARVGSLAKRKVKTATRAGYVYSKVSGQIDFDDIMAINRSLPIRGGRPMDERYLSPEQFAADFNRHGHAHVVKASDGRIVAYAVVPNIGDAWLFEYLMGHGDHLACGIMYLLLTKVIEEKFQMAHSPGNPSWIMYDNILGAPDGMRQFKTVLGFTPFWVRWRWDTPAAA